MWKIARNVYFKKSGLYFCYLVWPSATTGQIFGKLLTYISIQESYVFNDMFGNQKVKSSINVHWKKNGIDAPFNYFFFIYNFQLNFIQSMDIKSGENINKLNNKIKEIC